jgi:hypothetical protein
MGRVGVRVAMVRRAPCSRYGQLRSNRRFRGLKRGFTRAHLPRPSSTAQPARGSPPAAGVTRCAARRRQKPPAVTVGYCRLRGRGEALRPHRWGGDGALAAWPGARMSDLFDREGVKQVDKQVKQVDRRMDWFFLVIW